MSDAPRASALVTASPAPTLTIENPTTPTPTPTTDPTAAYGGSSGTAAPWISSIQDQEIVGAAQTKGWDKLNPTEAFAQAVKAHRSAEKMLGAPSDNLVRIPTRPDDEAGWRNVWQKLGAPEKPEGYQLDGLTLKDPELTTRFQDAVRHTAAELNMPKAMAERLAQSFHKFIGDTEQRVNAERSASVQADQDALASDWGAPGSDRYNANMFIANQATEKLGVSDQQLQKFRDAIGNAADVARIFHKIGVAMGEDKYIAGSNPVNNGIMSRDQASSRRAELMADAQWVDRYLKGGGPEKREMMSLNTLIAG